VLLVRVVDHREVLALLEEGAQAVEVLPPAEYRAVHIRGAIHLPLPRLWRGASTLLEPDRPVLVYCRDSL
jgi:rhodanese-related sulfurtransferase